MLDQFIGRFHPLFVHIPIGVIFVAIAFDLISRKGKYLFLAPAVPPLYLIGALGGVFSCMTGYLLSGRGEYDEDMVSTHMWAGIILSFLALGMFFWKLRKVESKLLEIGLPFSMLLLLTVTGHLGGNLTHGETYLTQYAPWNSGEEIRNRKVLTTEELPQAYVYEDIVQPILEEKCYSCHSSAKQKGKLRLDGISWMYKGGKSGKHIIAVDNFEESELITRIHLPIEEEEHMPPKGKPQISDAELALLSWWIMNGADTIQQVVDLAKPEEITTALADFVLTSQMGTEEEEIATVAPADPALIRKLKQKGLIILPISEEQNWLLINGRNVKEFGKEDWTLLSKLREQIYSLKLGNMPLSPEAIQSIAACKSLQELSLEQTNIEDKDMWALSELHELRTLNLTHTAVSPNGIEGILGLEKLQRVYVYGAEVPTTFSDSINDLGGLYIEAGGYILR